MKYCKYCHQMKSKFPKYDGIHERDMCCACYSRDTYERVMTKRLAERPHDVWRCVNCLALNAVSRKQCRDCKKNTREESIAEENKEKNL